MRAVAELESHRSELNILWTHHTNHHQRNEGGAATKLCSVRIEDAFAMKPIECSAWGDPLSTPDCTVDVQLTTTCPAAIADLSIKIKHMKINDREAAEATGLPMHMDGDTESSFTAAGLQHHARVSLQFSEQHHAQSIFDWTCAD